MSSLLDLETAVFKPQRKFGPITAQVTIRERHRDELFITEHPVEQGAAITDHAYKKPAEVVVMMGFSNSGIQSLATDLTALASLLPGGGEGGFNYINQIYDQLLVLQESRIPFSIITGKRKYSNMLIRDLSTETDETTENSLLITAICKQILIVATTAVSFPDASVMKNPQSNAATQNLGTKQPALTTLVPTGPATVGLPTSGGATGSF